MVSSAGNSNSETCPSGAARDLLGQCREPASRAGAFRILVSRYSGLVQGTASRVLRDGDGARDVAQAVFADLLRLLPNLRDDISLGGWLHRHTVFLAMRQLTSDRRREAREAEAQRRWDLAAPAFLPEDMAGGSGNPPGWTWVLDDALHGLSGRDRAVLVARYFQNQSLKALGESLGISAEAAGKRVTRALERLRVRLERRGIKGLSVTAGSLAAAASVMPPAPAGASVLAASALQAAAAASAPAAGFWTTFVFMNAKATLTGAAAAALLTAAVLSPVLLSQRADIADLRQQLQAARDAASAAAKTASAGATRRQPPGGEMATLSEKQIRFKALQDRQTAAKPKVDPWLEAIRQIDDAGRKQKALEEMIAALQSDDSTGIFAALTAYQSVGNVEFDRAPFRGPLTALLKNSDPLIRSRALYTIPGLPPDPGDLALVTEMAKDPHREVQEAVVNDLFWLTKGDLRTDTGAVVLDVLNRAEKPDRSLINVMWGAQFSPELEQKLVEFARRKPAADDGELRYYAVYSCLSTQNNKGPACVDLLLERLADPDSYNVGGRAAWGLAYGVQSGQGLEKKIADTAIKIWRNRSDQYLRSQLVKCISQYGDASHAASVGEIAAAPALGPEQRKEMTDLAASLQAKPPK